MLKIDELLADGEDGIERRHGVLEDHGDVAATQPALLLGRQVEDVAAIEADRARDDAGVGRQQVGYRRDEGGLAATAFADDADDLAGPRLEIDMAQGAHPSGRGGVVDREVGNGEEWTRHSDLRTWRRGSSASRNASPRKVKPSVARTSGRPPNTTMLGAPRRLA